MKLFIAYAKEPPYLPIAVAGSAAERDYLEYLIDKLEDASDES